MKKWLLKKDDQLAIVGYGPGAPSHLASDGWEVLFETEEQDAEVLDLITNEDGSLGVMVNPAKKMAKENKVHDAEVKAKWQAMRQERNQLLRETDFMLLEDAPVTATKKQEFKAYRKALRDLPGQITDINNFQWPVKPTDN